jgi:maleate isomerase
LYGNKAKIGLIVVAPDTTIEPEFNAMKPDGVSIHATRLPLTEGTAEAERKMLERTEEAAGLLAHAGVDIIVFGCTSASAMDGVGGDRAIISRIERATSIPATTPTTAVISALKELGVSKVALATPYNRELTRAIEKVLEGSGFRVVNTASGDYGLGMGRVLPETVYEQAYKVDTSDADAVFISCTNFKTLPFIDRLENELKKYVISSNTAAMWDVLRKLNIRCQIKGFGRLLAEF